MREKDRTLAAQCRTWARTARDAETWLQADPNSAENEVLCHDSRRTARVFDRLARAAERKMCVGVFGPSQAGKSYLVSALASGTNGVLSASFAGKAVDFLREINPEGGKESTGLVTRFTTDAPGGLSAQRPVRLRLFSEIDLVRVLANTYFADCDHKEAPDQDSLLARLRTLEQQAAGRPEQGPLTGDDVEDVREYLQHHFASRPRVQMLSQSYWTRATSLAPRLSLTDRAELFGCIWNNVPEFDSLFLRLARALEQLGFPAEADCSLEALLPREKSIIDVALLSPSTPGADETIELTAAGRQVRLARADVTALTAELTVYMPEKPDVFFEHTDLLDFPGYRSRLKITDLAAELRRPGSLEALFLRGKVAYLFERYCEEQELTGMILCIGPGPQEVQDLPGAIATWIAMTQGGTPAERATHDPTLFFVLTKADTAFERKQGSEDAGTIWQNRLFASIDGFFGAQHDWPAKWDGRPFRNCFLLRNPHIRSDALFSFDARGHEQGVRQDIRGFVDEVRQAFLATPAVRQHFADPDQAWNAVMALNDGGITLLRKNLAPVCDPDRKYAQTRDRACALASRFAARLAPYYRSDDLEELRRQKEQLAFDLVTALITIISAQQFAGFLRRLQVCDYDLYAIANDCADIPLTAPDSTEETPAAPTTVVGSAISAQDLLKDLFGSAAKAPEPVPAQPAVKETPAGEERPRDQAEFFSRRVVAFWIEHMQAVADDEHVQRVWNMDAAKLNGIVSELIQTARRIRLTETMAKAVREQTLYCNASRETLSWRMASEAACHINSFISWLGHDARRGQDCTCLYNGQSVSLFTPPAVSIGPLGDPLIPEQPTQYDQAYCTDWLKSFSAHIIQSAGGIEDGFDPVRNKKLGELIDTLTATQQSGNTPEGSPA